MAITKHDLKSLIESLSHKLRTPLSVISNNAHFIGKEHTAAHEDVVMILKKVREMSELLSEIYHLLDYTPETREFCLGTLAEDLDLSLGNNIASTAITAEPRLLKSILGELTKLLPLRDKCFIDSKTIQLNVDKEHPLKSKEALLTHAPQLAALTLQLADLGGSFEVSDQTIYLRLA